MVPTESEAMVTRSSSASVALQRPDASGIFGCARGVDVMF